MGPFRPTLLTTQWPLSINWADPVTRDLALAVVGQRNLVDGAVGTLNTNAAKAAHRLGVGYKNSSSSSGGLTVTSPKNLGVNGDFTVIVLAASDSSSQYSNIFSVPYSTSYVAPYASIMFRRNSNTTGAHYLFATSASTFSSVSNTVSYFLTDNQFHYYGLTRRGNTISFWRDGAILDVQTASGAADWTPQKAVTLFGAIPVSAVDGIVGTHATTLFFNRCLADGEYQELVRYPFPERVFVPPSRRLWAPIASGAVTHATSGALTGGPATLAGTAAHISVHGSTGALSGAGSTLAGTAAHIVVHSSTGALAGAGGALSGTAARLHAFSSTGALAGGGATITGSSARAAAGVHDASGSLAAGGAALAGTAARIAPHATTGALAGAGATLAGTAAHVATHTTTGALVGAAAIVAGTAAHKVVHAANGILVGGGAALTGAASRPAPASASASSAIGGPASLLFSLSRGELQYPSTREAQASWDRLLTSVRPTRIE